MHLQSLSALLLLLVVVPPDRPPGGRSHPRRSSATGHVLVTWVGADLDVTLARAWYGMLSATRQRGGVEGNDQVYGGVSFRF